MKKVLVIPLALAVSALVFAQPAVAPPRTPPKIDLAKPTLPDEKLRTLLLALLGAVEGDNFPEFTRHCTDDFKARLTKEEFSRAVEIVAARMENGYDIVYFGTCKREPYTIHLWKLVFKDNARDILGEFSVQTANDGKVDNFYIH